MRVFHNVEPIFDKNAKVLLLGTMPSPKSREAAFPYSHPQNRFWKVLFHIFNEPFSKEQEDRRQLLLSHHIALWDVVESCDITGASDSSIKNAIPNDLDRILHTCDIRQIFTTGKTAHRLLLKLTEKQATCLPSTSGANCALPFDRLTDAYSEILEYFD